MKTAAKRSPWAWIPTLYFAQGIPYVAVMTISVILYKRLGLSNTDIALYTGWLGLPWVIKPFWSPFVDLIRTKRWWTLTMQWIVAFALAGIAFTIPTAFFVQFTLAIFMLMGFASATHDIAADGYYMLALTEHEQSLYVGIRSTFYRVATVVGQGLLVVLAGVIEMNTGIDPVEMQMIVDPDEPATISSIYMYPDLHPDNPTFIVGMPEKVAVKTPETVMGADSVEVPYAVFAKQMRDSVAHMNARNGFITLEEQGATAQAKTQEWSGFRTWLRDNFGEERQEAAALNSNLVIATVKLSHAPEEGKPLVLITNFAEGDQSVKLDAESARLVFTADNWEQPAYLLFTIDPKIKSATSATFRGTSGDIPMAWSIVFIVLSVFFFIVVIYHNWALPKPASDHAAANASAKDIFKGFVDAFATFFTKFPLWQTVAAIAFMILYRFPEAQLTKIIQPFLLDPIDKGGLGLTTGEVGLVYGTVGIIGLTIGGIIGGIVAAKGGLKKWLLPMAWSMSLTCLTFVYLSYFQDHSLLTVNICVFIEQFGYGFGFTAYMLYLIYYSEGKFKTSHYAICTGLMALSMMTGMMAGWVQETIGYKHFFVWTIICCVATIVVAMCVKVDPSFGKKEEKE
ncbi:MAG: MFS transporter [Bacteroidales bacterium]|nr:MFS transporter [Bacteroidales bacterium]